MAGRKVNEAVAEFRKLALAEKRVEALRRDLEDRVRRLERDEVAEYYKMTSEIDDCRRG